MTDETGQLVILDCPIDRSANARGQRDNYDAAFGRRKGPQSSKGAEGWFGEEWAPFPAHDNLARDLSRRDSSTSAAKAAHVGVLII